MFMSSPRTEGHPQQQARPRREGICSFGINYDDFCADRPAWRPEDFQAPRPVKAKTVQIQDQRNELSHHPLQLVLDGEGEDQQNVAASDHEERMVAIESCVEDIMRRLTALDSRVVAMEDRRASAQGSYAVRERDSEDAELLHGRLRVLEEQLAELYEHFTSPEPLKESTGFSERDAEACLRRAIAAALAVSVEIQPWAHEAQQPSLRVDMLCPCLVLPACESLFAVSIAQLQRSAREDVSFDVLGLSGSPLLRAMVCQAEGGQRLDLSMVSGPTASPQTVPMASVRPRELLAGNHAYRICGTVGSYGLLVFEVSSASEAAQRCTVIREDGQVRLHILFDPMTLSVHVSETWGGAGLCCIERRELHDKSSQLVFQLVPGVDIALILVTVLASLVLRNTWCSC